MGSLNLLPVGPWAVAAMAVVVGIPIAGTILRLWMVNKARDRENEVLERLCKGATPAERPEIIRAFRGEQSSVEVSAPTGNGTPSRSSPSGLIQGLLSGWHRPPAGR